MSETCRGLVVACVLLVVLLSMGPPVYGESLSVPDRQGTTIHVVQWGESVAIIAPRYGVSIGAIAQAIGRGDEVCQFRVDVGIEGE